MPVNSTTSYPFLNLPAINSKKEHVPPRYPLFRITTYPRRERVILNVFYISGQVSSSPLTPPPEPHPRPWGIPYALWGINHRPRGELNLETRRNHGRREHDVI